MVLSQPEDLDVIGLAEDDLEAAFQVFFVRGGRVLGRKGWVVDRVEQLERPQLVASFLEQLYMERPDPPPTVLVPSMPSDAEVIGAWLEGLRGSRVRVTVPERGAKRKLQDVVTRNAEEAFHRHKLRRASDFGARSRALTQLAEELGLEQAPLRIECYDISNLGPTDKVASMVVFEDGLPKRAGLPPVPDQGGRRPGRLRLDGGDAPPTLHAPPPGAGAAPRGAPATLLVPAGAGRDRRWPWAARAGVQGAGRARPVDPAHRPREEARGGLRPGITRPPADPARVRGAVRPAAHPGRGAPLRRAVPPGEAPEAGPRVTARRCARRGARAQASPDEAVRVAREDQGSGRGGPGRDPGDRARARVGRSTGSCRRRPPRPRGAPRERRPGARRLARPRFHDRHRAVGRRPVRGGAQPGGPRVLRRRQPPADAAAEDGRAHRTSGRSGPVRHRGGRPRRGLLRGARARLWPSSATSGSTTGSSSSRHRTTIS